GNLARRSAQAGRSVPAFADEVLVVGKIEVLRGALGNAAAAEQTYLSYDIIPVGDAARNPFALLLIHDFDGRRIDLERHPGTIHGSGQQRDDDRADQPECNRAEDQPAPIGDDSQQGSKVEAARIRRGTGSRPDPPVGRITVNYPRAVGLGYREVVVHQTSSIRKA